MALEAVQTAPQVNDFTPLSHHEEQTPGTFFGGSPVLHLHSPGATIKISVEDLQSQPALSSLQDEDVLAGADGQATFERVDVWVTSTYAVPIHLHSYAELMRASHLILYSPAKSNGVRIPYPTITVHAQDGNAIFLGLNLSDANTADEDLVFVQLRIIPTSVSSHTEGTEVTAEPQEPNGHTPPSPSQALFKAISDCQELNPDPPEDGEEDMDDETAPGATGWITSENIGDFLDEHGELKMPEGIAVVGAEADGDAAAAGLGEGAGRTRTAAEVDDEDGEDETKWQRTG